MKKRFGLVAAWFLATALAVGVASQAVGLVADRAVGIPVEVPIAVSGQSSAGPITAPPSESTTPITPGLSTTSTTVPSATTIAGSGTTTTTGATTTTTTTVPPAPTIPASFDSRTYYLPGGQVSVACTGPDTITYLSAVPAPGWKLELESSGPAKVRADFKSGDEEEESEIEIVCRDGQLDEDISD